MIIRLTPETQQSLISIIYIFIAIIIFLWGKAIGFNETAEAFKIADKKRTVEKLRIENDELKSKIKLLIFENERLTKWKHTVKKSVEVK